MIIACPACEARFNVDPAKLAPAGRTVRCAKCGHRWRVDARGNAVQEAEPAAVAAAGAARTGQELPTGPSARELLSRQAAGAPPRAAKAAPLAEAPAGEGAVMRQPPSPFAETGDVSEGGAGEAADAAEPAADGGSRRGESPEPGAPREPTAPATPAPSAQAPAPSGRAALSPRERQKLRQAAKGRSRTRLYVLLVLVVVAVALLLVVMQRGPQIESMIRERFAQPVESVPAEPTQPAPPGGAQ